MKKIYIVILLIIVLVVGIVLKVKEENKKETIDPISIDASYDIDDELETWDNATEINLNELDNNLNITNTGTYHLTGTLNDKSIIIDSTGVVRLVLDNVTINSIESSIYVKDATKLIITLAPNSINNLTDTSNYKVDVEGEPNATIFIKSDLTINGSGTLNIKSNYEDSIASKDGLKIMNGNINIESKDDGIRGKDYVVIKNGNFNIETDGDGIKSTDTDNCYILIENGNFNINATNDGIQSEMTLNIKNGVFNITTGGGSINSSTKNDWGMWGNTTNTSSAKGIKSVNSMTIENGVFTIDSSDDAIHSNEHVYIAGGEFKISSGDDGIHADSTLEINDGNINITKSYEGLEATNVNINNGSIYVVASDDGINIAGGNDSSSMNRPGANNFTSSSNQNLTINNGYVYIDATGDGLDANGGIIINDGMVIINGPTDNGNGALDYDIKCQVNGGTLIAVGSSGMMQTPSSDSSIYTISTTFSTKDANTIFHLEDSEGNEIITFSPSKNYQSVIISSSLIEKGKEYIAYTNGSYDNDNKDGLYSNGNYEKGTKIGSVTISSIINYIGSNNSFNGGMIPGNDRRPR